MSNIANTIKSTIVNSIETKHGVGIEAYDQYVNTATDALVEAQYQVVESIVRQAEQSGDYSKQDVLYILSGAGLEERPAPEPVVKEVPQQVEDESDLGQVLHAIAKLGNRLDTIESAARRNGISL